MFRILSLVLMFAAGCGTEPAPSVTQQGDPAGLAATPTPTPEPYVEPTPTPGPSRCDGIDGSTEEGRHGILVCRAEEWLESQERKDKERQEREDRGEQHDQE